MDSAILLGDEPDRVAAVKALGLLDTPAEKRFDRITRLATNLFGTPIALVSLLDSDRQWFKSCVGLADRQTDRGISFCGHAILQGDVFVVEDATKDERFADNPLVTRTSPRPLLRRRPRYGRHPAIGLARCASWHASRGRSRRPTARTSSTSPTSSSASWRRPNCRGRRRRSWPVRRAWRASSRGPVTASWGSTTTAGSRSPIRRPAPSWRWTRRTSSGCSSTKEHHRSADGSPFPWQECPSARTLREGIPSRVADETYLRHDGTVFPVEYTSNPIVEAGQVTGAVVIFQDVSARREVDSLKDEFVSIVSHELRTPLTSIRGSLGLLASGALGEMDGRGQRMLEIAVESTDRLVRLVNDILDLERLRSGRSAFQHGALNLGRVMQSAAQEVAGTAAAADVRLVVEPVDIQLEADQDRVLQVLTNLLGNAVKFSPPGGHVAVSAVVSGDEVTITVTDEGRGIPPAKLLRIFSPFEQVDASDSRAKGGTGLGLAISKSIVEQHGGRIWAESEGGHGSRFFVALPLRQPAASATV